MSLLVDGERVPMPALTPLRLPVASEPSRCSEAQLYLRLALYTVRLASTSAACVAALRGLCEAFVIDPDATVDDELWIDVQEEAAGAATFVATRGNEVLRREYSPEALASRLEWWLCNEAIQRSAALLHLHGGAATKNGRAVLLPAHSGAGKSTLTLGLLARGFEVLGDDVTFIDLQAAVVLPFWRSFHLDVRSLCLLAQLGVHCAAGRWHGHTYPPSSFGLNRPPEPARLRFIILPDREGLPPGTLVRLSQAQAAAAIVPLASALRRGSPTALAALPRLLTGCACYRLGTGNLQAAVDVIDGLVSSA